MTILEVAPFIAQKYSEDISTESKKSKMFQSTWQLEIVSLIVGLALGGVLVFGLVKFWPKIRLAWLQIRSWFRAKNAWIRANSETRFRTEMAMSVQNRHMLGKIGELSHVFVPPRLLTPDIIVSSDNGHHSGTEQLFMLWPEDASVVALEPPGTISLRQLLRRGRRLVISGEVGTGKTSLLAFVAALGSPDDPSGEYVSFANKLPVFLHISELAIAADAITESSYDDKAEPLFLAAFALTARISTLDRNDIVNLLINRAIDNTLLLLIDGLDETSAEKPPWFINWVKQLLTTYPDIQILIASSVDGNGPLIEVGFLESKILPWRAGQVELLHKMVSKEREDLPEFSDDVIWIPGQSALLTILRLVVAIDNHNRQAQLTSLRRIEIFEIVCRQLLAAISQSSDDWLAPAAREYWQVIAFELAKKKIGYLTDEQLKLHAESILMHYNAGDIPRAEAKLRQTLWDSGLFVRYPENALGCLSPQWRDFLSASYLSQTGQKQFVKNHLNDPNWQDIISFYIGRAGAGELASMILQDGESIFSEGLFQLATWIPETLEKGKWRREVLVRLGKQIMDKSLPLSWRQRATLILAQTGEEGVAVLLNQLLREPNPALRQAAIGGMARVDPQSAVGPIQRMMEDSEQAVRTAAVHALGWIDEPATDHMVVKALLEPDEPVCRAAARSLALNGTDDDHKILQEAITDESLSVRRAAVDGLAIVDEHWSSDLLRQVASDDQQRAIRLAAGIALQQSNGDSDLSVWQPRQAGEQSWLVNWAVNQGRVVPIGSAAIPVLLEALRDSDAGIRHLAALTLGELGVKIARDPLRIALEDPDVEVRNAAFNALYRIDRLWSMDSAIPALAS